MSLLMGPAPRRDNGHGIQAKVTTERPKSDTLKGPTAKALKTFCEMLDRISFDPAEFAQIMTMMPVGIQRRFIEVVIAYFRRHHNLIEIPDLAPNMPEENYELSVTASQIYKRLKPFHG